MTEQQKEQIKNIWGKYNIKFYSDISPVWFKAETDSYSVSFSHIDKTYTCGYGEWWIDMEINSRIQRTLMVLEWVEKV